MDRGEKTGLREVVRPDAPVSTTGILGLIIQMWMLLLENTRSRVEAIASTIDLYHYNKNTSPPLFFMDKVYCLSIFIFFKLYWRDSVGKTGTIEEGWVKGQWARFKPTPSLACMPCQRLLDDTGHSLPVYIFHLYIILPNQLLNKCVGIKRNLVFSPVLVHDSTTTITPLSHHYLYNHMLELWVGLWRLQRQLETVTHEDMLRLASRWQTYHISTRYCRLI